MQSEPRHVYRRPTPQQRRDFEQSLNEIQAQRPEIEAWARGELRRLEAIERLRMRQG